MSPFTDGSCTFTPTRKSGASAAFPVGLLLQSSGIVLDDQNVGLRPTASSRYSGRVLQLTIDYNNIYPWTGAGEVEFTIAVEAVPNSNFKLDVPTYTDGNLTSRVVQTKSGLRVNVVQTGTVGSYDATTFLLQFTTSLTLVTVATTVIDLLMLYVLKNKKKYAEMK